MESLLDTTQGSKTWIPPSIHEPKKYKFTRFLNLFGLNVFLLYYILNFILIGFYEAYALIMIVSAFYAFANILYVIAKKEYQIRGLKYIKYLYIATVITLILCFSFFLYGLILIGESNEDNFSVGKWMVIFSVLHAFESITFVCFAKESKTYFEE